MYIRCNFEEFVKAVYECGRGDQFSKTALKLIYDYLVENELESEPYILDVIGICCDFSETTLDSVFNDTGLTLEELQEKSLVLVDRNVVVYAW